MLLKQLHETAAETPTLLYHGSHFKQSELKPSYKHTGKLVRWDKTESNYYLYATSERTAAIELGFASSIEKLFDIDRFSVDGKEIVIETNSSLAFKDLLTVPVYLYAIRYKESDGWVKNHNDQNGLDDVEFKTTGTITAIVSRKRINVRKWIKQYQVTITRSGITKKGA